MTVDRMTNRWLGISAIAFFAAGVGVLANRPAVLLVAVVSVTFAAYARTANAPTVSLDVSRTVSDSEPEPGDDVTVSVSVTNTSDRVLPDLRLVDGVPAALEVTDESPRTGTALRPGKHTAFSYTVTATRGTHTFNSIHVVARDASGTVERETERDVETTITCTPTYEESVPVPLLSQTIPYAGRVPTEIGGSGVEFHATRDYRPGDPLSRIDWRRRARTGRLATLEFREERAATVIVLVDTRDAARVGADEIDTDAVNRGVAAAGRLFASLLDTGDRVGLAAFGPGEYWLAPGSGRDQWTRARDALSTNLSFAPASTGEQFFGSAGRHRLRRQLPANAQIVAVTPLCDDGIVTTIQKLEAYGHATTVISPDVTVDNTTGRRLARIQRRVRIGDLRRQGVRVIDWSVNESLDVTLERSKERWSR